MEHHELKNVANSCGINNIILYFSQLEFKGPAKPVKY